MKKLDQIKGEVALKLIKLTLILFIFFGPNNVVSQLNEAKYRQLQEEHEYLEVFEKKEQKKEDSQESYLDDEKNEEQQSTESLQLISFLALAALVIVILVFIMRRQSKKVKNQPLKVSQKISTQIEDIEDIEEIDTSKLLLESETDESFNYSIRVLFIDLLKKYHAAKLIDWQPKKTNRNYLNEILAHPSYKQMKHLTKIYEEVWYGENKIDEEKYRLYKEQFKLLISKIGSEEQQ